MQNEAIGLRGRSCEISSQVQDTSFSKSSKLHIAFLLLLAFTQTPSSIEMITIFYGKIRIRINNVLY